MPQHSMFRTQMHHAFASSFYFLLLLYFSSGDCVFRDRFLFYIFVYEKHLDVAGFKIKIKLFRRNSKKFEEIRRNSKNTKSPLEHPKHMI